MTDLVCHLHGSEYLYNVGLPDGRAWMCLVCSSAALNDEDPDLLEASRTQEIMADLNRWLNPGTSGQETDTIKPEAKGQ